MYIIEREFNIAIGHCLSKHKGKCKNAHGHEIRILVSIKSDKLNFDDMVMDFGYLKEIGNMFIEQFDHSMLLNKSEDKLINVLKDKMNRVHEFDNDPTAEFLSKYLYDNIGIHILQNFPGVEMNYVKIYENEKSNATYME